MFTAIPWNAVAICLICEHSETFCWSRRIVGLSRGCSIHTRMTCTKACCEYCGIINCDRSLFPSTAIVCRKMLIHDTTVSGVRSHFSVWQHTQHRYQSHISCIMSTEHTSKSSIWDHVSIDSSVTYECRAHLCMYFMVLSQQSINEQVKEGTNEPTNQRTNQPTTLIVFLFWVNWVDIATSIKVSK